MRIWQYSSLLRDPSKIWCYMGQGRLGAAFHYGDLRYFYCDPWKEHAHLLHRDHDQQRARDGGTDGILAAVFGNVKRVEDMQAVEKRLCRDISQG